MIKESELNQHYSQKGGHKARREYWKLMDEVKSQWSSRCLPVIVLDIQCWSARRKMFRDQKDGRR